jgi:hypothetical protein
VPVFDRSFCDAKVGRVDRQDAPSDRDTFSSVIHRLMPDSSLEDLRRKGAPRIDGGNMELPANG